MDIEKFEKMMVVKKALAATKLAEDATKKAEELLATMPTFTDKQLRALSVDKFEDGENECTFWYGGANGDSHPENSIGYLMYATNTPEGIVAKVRDQGFYEETGDLQIGRSGRSEYFDAVFIGYLDADCVRYGTWWMTNGSTFIGQMDPDKNTYGTFRNLTGESVGNFEEGLAFKLILGITITPDEQLLEQFFREWIDEEDKLDQYQTAQLRKTLGKIIQWRRFCLYEDCVFELMWSIETLGTIKDGVWVWYPGMEELCEFVDIFAPRVTYIMQGEMFLGHLPQRIQMVKVVDETASSKTHGPRLRFHYEQSNGADTFPELGYGLRVRWAYFLDQRENGKNIFLVDGAMNIGGCEGELPSYPNQVLIEMSFFKGE